MNDTKKVINELLVEVFHHILSIEGQKLRERGVDLSMSEVHVLEAIEKSPDPTMTNIANRLRVTVGTLTTAINRLVQKGYVVRSKDTEDKRKVYVRLSKKASDVMKIHDQFHEEMINAVITDMNLEEDTVLLQSLANINKYFKEKY